MRPSARCGTQLVRAGKGRWSAKAELAFLEALARTACVRRACAASGFSATAVYNRRKGDPEFADRWRAALAAAWEEVDRVAICATLASFDPELAAADMPKVTMAELITLMRMRGFGKAPGAGAEVAEPDIEAVRARILAKIEAIEQARGREEA